MQQCISRAMRERSTYLPLDIKKKKKSNLASKREKCVNQPREEKITFITPNSHLWNKVWKSYWGQLWTQWKQTTTACFIMYLTSLWMRGDESVCKTRITSSTCSDLNSNYLEESSNHRCWLPVLQSLTRNFSHGSQIDLSTFSGFRHPQL